MHRDTAHLAFSKRDFWLCLARAFAPPAAGQNYLDTFRTDLPADLVAIADEMGLQFGAEVEDFRAAAARIADSLELQKLYAALFLTPPAPVMLNTGIYLDGTLLGDSEQELNAFYARHGFERHPEFRDLNDTPGVQCEFLGLLYDKVGRHALANEDMDAMACIAEAERFIARYPRRWITPCLRDLERACETAGLNGVYVHLARILWLTVEETVSVAAGRLDAVPEVVLPEGSSLGVGAITAEDLAEIACRLEEAGLGYDHVAQHEGWSDEAFAARRAADVRT